MPIEGELLFGKSLDEYIDTATDGRGFRSHYLRSQFTLHNVSSAVQIQSSLPSQVQSSSTASTFPL